MPKNIPIDLLDHLGQPMITTSYRLRIKLRSGAYLGMTTLSRDEIIDDGDGVGPIVFHAATGVELSACVANNDLSVDNSEASTLVPVFPMPGIDLGMVERGDLDGAEFVVFCHNWRDPSQGSFQWQSGVLGPCRVEQEMLVVTELRSWLSLLQQTGIISQTSRDCRAQFGSQPGTTREPCGYDLTGEWVDFTVTSVGAEDIREFTDSALVQAADYFLYGHVRFATGDNAGLEREIESFAAGGAVSMRFTFPRPIKVGDSGQLRRGCSNKWTGFNSCETFFGPDKGKHFQGEPYLNIGDAIANSVPGVNSTVGTGGSGG